MKYAILIPRKIQRSPMKFSRRTFGVLLVVVIAVVVGVLVFIQLTAKPADSFSPSAAVVEPAAPSYIGNSSIYLLSAKPYYGTQHGTHVFMVNVTVRNDYTVQQPPPGSPITRNSTGTAYIILSANLYDKNGAQISVQEYIPPQDHPDWNQVGLNSGETASLTIYMATTNRNVDYYSLYFGHLGAAPVP